MSDQPEKTPPKPANSKTSPEYWQKQLQKPLFTGVAASVVLFLMKTVGMMPAGWLIILLPAIAGGALHYHLQQEEKKKSSSNED